MDYDVCHYCNPYCGVWAVLCNLLWFLSILFEWKRFHCLIFNDVIVYLAKKNKSKYYCSRICIWICKLIFFLAKMTNIVTKNHNNKKRCSRIQFFIIVKKINFLKIFFPFFYSLLSLSKRWPILLWDATVVVCQPSIVGHWACGLEVGSGRAGRVWG